LWFFWIAGIWGLLIISSAVTSMFRSDQPHRSTAITHRDFFDGIRPGWRWPGQGFDFLFIRARDPVRLSNRLMIPSMIEKFSYGNGVLVIVWVAAGPRNA